MDPRSKRLHILPLTHGSSPFPDACTLRCIPLILGTVTFLYIVILSVRYGGLILRPSPLFDGKDMRKLGVVVSANRHKRALSDARVLGASLPCHDLSQPWEATVAMASMDRQKQRQHLTPRSRLVLMHVPKTGGTSLSVILPPLLGRALALAPEWRKYVLPPSYRRDHVWKAVLSGSPLIHGHFDHSVTDSVRAMSSHEILSMAMVRHPIRMHLSNWAFKQTPSGRPPEYMRYRSPPGYDLSLWRLPVHRFVRSKVHPEDGWNDQTAWMAGAAMGFVTSLNDPATVAALRGDPQVMLEQAVDNLRAMWWFGITEHWDASMALLHHRLGLQVGPAAWKRNEVHRNRSPLIMENVTDADMTELSCRSHTDMALFYYAEDLFVKELRRCRCFDMVSFENSPGRQFTRRWRIY